MYCIAPSWIVKNRGIGVIRSACNPRKKKIRVHFDNRLQRQLSQIVGKMLREWQTKKISFLYPNKIAPCFKQSNKCFVLREIIQTLQKTARCILYILCTYAVRTLCNNCTFHTVQVVQYNEICSTAEHTLRIPNDITVFVMQNSLKTPEPEGHGINNYCKYAFLHGGYHIVQYCNVCQSGPRNMSSWHDIIWA